MAALPPFGPPPTSAAPSAAGGPARAPWGIVELLLALLLTVILLLAVTLAFVLALAAAGIDEDPEVSAAGAAGALLAQLVIDAGAVGIAALFSLRRYKLSPRAWGLRPARVFHLKWSVLTLLACFGTLVAYQAAVSALGIQEFEARENVPEGLLDHRAVIPLTVFLVVIVAPLAEEMFFRAFIFGGLRRLLGVYGGAAASGLLFSVIHVQGADYIGLVIPFGIIGFMLAVLVARTGSLWNAILVHFGFNAFGIGGALAGGPGALLAVFAIAGVYVLASLLPAAPTGDNR